VKHKPWELSSLCIWKVNHTRNYLWLLFPSFCFTSRSRLSLQIAYVVLSFIFMLHLPHLYALELVYGVAKNGSCQACIALLANTCVLSHTLFTIIIYLLSWFQVWWNCQICWFVNVIDDLLFSKALLNWLQDFVSIPFLLSPISLCNLVLVVGSIGTLIRQVEIWVMRNKIWVTFAYYIIQILKN